MAEGPYDTDPGTPGTQLDPALLAAIQEAVAAGMAAQVPLAAPPPEAALTMTTTPKLGLKQPSLDDPALITDINDNMTVLDDAITATVAATLYNKTLEAPIINNPTINGWTNAAHTHLNAASGGGLDGAAITSGYLGTGLLLREGSPGGTLVDPIVRDTLQFAPEPTGAVDAILQRVAAKALMTDSNLGLGVAPEGNMSADHKALRFGVAGNLFSNTSAVNPQVNLTSNSYYPGGPSVYPLFGTWPASKITLMNGTITLDNAPAVAVGSPQAFTTRFQVAADGGIGIGATPEGWATGNEIWRYIRIGQSGSINSNANANGIQMSVNFKPEAGQNRPIVDSVRGSIFSVGAGTLIFFNCPPVALGANQVYQNRLEVTTTGTTAVIPDKLNPAFWANTGAAGQENAGYHVMRMGGLWRLNLFGTANAEYAFSVSRDGSSDHALILDPVNAQSYVLGHWVPHADNAAYLGVTAKRWLQVWAVSGTIQTSTVEAKNDRGLVDPEEALAEVLRVPVHRFTYKPPPIAPLPDLPEDAGEREREARAEALRSQEMDAVVQNYERIGFMAEEVTVPEGGDALLLVGPDSVEPQNTAGVLMAALQAVALQVVDLRARLGALEDAAA